MSKLRAPQIDTGTGANQIVELDSSSRLPAVDASQVTNVPYTPVPINTDATTNRTLVLGDAGEYVRMTNAGANTVTVPLNSSVAFAIGTEIIVRQAGAGATTIVATGGVTINTPNTLVLAGQHETVSLIKVGTDEWDLTGATV